MENVGGRIINSLTCTLVFCSGEIFMKSKMAVNYERYCLHVLRSTKRLISLTKCFSAPNPFSCRKETWILYADSFRTEIGNYCCHRVVNNNSINTVHFLKLMWLVNTPWIETWLADQLIWIVITMIFYQMPS